MIMQTSPEVSHRGLGGRSPSHVTGDSERMGGAEQSSRSNPPVSAAEWPSFSQVII